MKLDLGLLRRAAMFAFYMDDGGDAVHAISRVVHSTSYPLRVGETWAGRNLAALDGVARGCSGTSEGRALIKQLGAGTVLDAAAGSFRISVPSATRAGVHYQVFCITTAPRCSCSCPATKHCWHLDVAAALAALWNEAQPLPPQWIEIDDMAAAALDSDDDLSDVALRCESHDSEARKPARVPQISPEFAATVGRASVDYYAHWGDF